MASPTRADLSATLAAHGLSLRGGWVPLAADALPALPDGRAAAVVWMVGVAGSGFWPHFKASAFYQDGLPDPLDRWSAHIGHALATQLGGRALFPFEGPPYFAFQRWADRSEPTQTSPLMLRIHPHYGLWHAYRFALALPDISVADAQALAAQQTTQGHTPPGSLCADCSGQPCLSACPVDAFTGNSYRMDACAAHLRTEPAGDCMRLGCRARRACPVGPEFRYAPEHAAFHMQAFTKSH